ncbi:MAG: NAD(P)-binding domain-containing protein, partial [Deltaproteobacteria bacterium]|nr:NAD(P)-binding domain-containing protein [Deltaproteobacteria bacterium]
MSDVQIKKVTVIGAGNMGRAIAQEFGQKGFLATLVGRSREKTDQALEQFKSSLGRLVELELIHKDSVEPTLGRINTSIEIGESVERADLIIESIIEDLDIKKDLFRTVEKACSPQAIIATNTSSIVPSLLADAFHEQSRFLVTDYFNLPYLMPLVEHVHGPKTTAENMDRMEKLYIAV